MFDFHALAPATNFPTFALSVVPPIVAMPHPPAHQHLTPAPQTTALQACCSIHVMWSQPGRPSGAHCPCSRQHTYCTSTTSTISSSPVHFALTPGDGYAKVVEVTHARAACTRHHPKPVLLSRLSDMLSVGRNIEVRDFAHTTLCRQTAPSIFHPRENRLKRFIQFRLGHSAVCQLLAQYCDGHPGVSLRGIRHTDARCEPTFTQVMSHRIHRVLFM
jgi:hypothetical protein